jgi:hypothetical protein
MFARNIEGCGVVFACAVTDPSLATSLSSSKKASMPQGSKVLKLKQTTFVSYYGKNEALFLNKLPPARHPINRFRPTTCSLSRPRMSASDCEPRCAISSAFTLRLTIHQSGQQSTIHPLRSLSDTTKSLSISDFSSASIRSSLPAFTRWQRLTCTNPRLTLWLGDSGNRLRYLALQGCWSTSCLRPQAGPSEPPAMRSKLYIRQPFSPP